MDIDKHNQKYRHLLREAKQSLLLETRVDYYAVLGLEKSAVDAEIRKAYFKKSKEYQINRIVYIQAYYQRTSEKRLKYKYMKAKFYLPRTAIF